jgi:sugar/nucleoside kinase (ribokinase family)
MGQVVCVGLTTWDVVQVADRVPGEDEKIVASDGWMAFGGPAANAAATCAALGVPVRLVTALGTGQVADLARSGLARAGVEVVDLAQDGEDLLAVSSVIVTGEHRSVVSRNGRAAPDLGDAAATAVEDGLIVVGAGDVVLVDGHHLTAGIAVARRAKAAGATVLADAGSWKPGLDGLLAQVDVAVLSADLRVPQAFWPPDASDLLDVVARMGPAVVARSAGASPMVVRDSAGARTQIVPAAVTVVDTLGAGDVLHGAIAASLARGVGLEESLRDGVERATWSVRHRGAMGWCVEPGA